MTSEKVSTDRQVAGHRHSASVPQNVLFHPIFQQTCHELNDFIASLSHSKGRLISYWSIMLISIFAACVGEQVWQRLSGPLLRALVCQRFNTFQ
jgi:hypothetical protein